MKIEYCSLLESWERMNFILCTVSSLSKVDFINTMTCLCTATEVILQNMEMETEMGVKAREMLYRGEAVSEQMVAKMLEDKIRSPEVSLFDMAINVTLRASV